VVLSLLFLKIQVKNFGTLFFYLSTRIDHLLMFVKIKTLDKIFTTGNFQFSVLSFDFRYSIVDFQFSEDIRYVHVTTSNI